MTPSIYYIYQRLRDTAENILDWTGITYENWFILGEAVACRLRKFRRRLLFKLGWDLTADLAYHADVHAVSSQIYDAFVAMWEMRGRATRGHHGELEW